MGLLLLAAAALKGWDLIRYPVPGRGWLDSRPLLTAVVDFEMFFGLWLAFAPRSLLARVTWIAAVGCFSLFGAVALLKALSGEATCGCFGRSLPVHPFFTFFLDLSIVAALLRFRRGWATASARADQRRALGRCCLVTAAWLVLAVASGIAIAHSRAEQLTAKPVEFGGMVLLEPETWVGQRLPLLQYIDARDRLDAGVWTVVLYHRGCPNCRKVIDRLGCGDTHRTGRVALVEVPEMGRSIKAVSVSNPAFVLARLEPSKEWFVSTPTVLTLKDGIVTSAQVPHSLVPSFL